MVVGYATQAVERLVPLFSEKYGVVIEPVHNDKALEWNNPYSLW